MLQRYIWAILGLSPHRGPYHRHRKLSQLINISMKLLLELTVLPIFRLRYRSGWPEMLPIAPLLWHVAPNLLQNYTLTPISPILGISSVWAPQSIHIHSFCFLYQNVTSPWNEMQTMVALTTIISSKIYWNVNDIDIPTYFIQRPH